MRRTMKILVIGREERTKKYTDPKRYAEHEFSFVPLGASAEEMLEKGCNADIIFADAMAGLPAKVISRMPNLKMIHSEGVGFNGIDVREAARRQVFVCNCGGINASAVAEQALLLMLGLLRDVCNGDRQVREGKQIEVKESYMRTGSLKELGECTIGLVGFGDIGKATAGLARGFGAKVIYFAASRKPRELEEAYSVVYQELDQLLKVSDIVSLHLPVTPETQNLANAEFFAKMKRGAYLINTSRGEIVDSKALLAAIRNGHLAGAGLDTIAGEPVTSDNIILQAEREVEERIIYSCHIGGITGAAFRRGYERMWSNTEKVAAGKMPDHVVNRWW